MNSKAGFLARIWRWLVGMSMSQRGLVVIRMGMFILGIGLSGLLLLPGIVRQSPTSDEGYHAIRGVALWWTRDSRLSYAHPALMNALQGFPSWLLEEPIDFSKTKAFKRGQVESLRMEMLRKDPEKLFRIITRGRYVTAALFALAGLYLVLFMWRRWGELSALIGGIFWLANTSLLAHAQLFTTDAAVALMAMIAGLEWLRFLFPGPSAALSWKSFLRMALSFGLLAAVKYNGLVLALVFLALTVVVAGLNQGLFRGRSILHKTGLLAGASLGVMVISIFVVDASYGFQNTWLTVREFEQMQEPDNPVSRRFKGQLVEKSLMGRLPEALPIPLPYSYVFGALSIAAHNKQGHQSWFCGEIRKHGWRSYFPILFLIKTPAAMLLGILLFAASLLLRIMKWGTGPPAELILLAAVAGFALMLLSQSQLNIGFRHALAVEALLVPVATWGLIHWLGLGTGWRRILLLALSLTTVLGALVAPEYIGDFNGLVGRDRGAQMSQIGEDWGQDVNTLARLAKTRGWEPMYYEYMYIEGRYTLKLKGVHAEPLACSNTLKGKQGYVAVHRAKHLRQKKACYPWRKRARLIDTINGHIDVYALRP